MFVFWYEIREKPVRKIFDKYKENCSIKLVIDILQIFLRLTQIQKDRILLKKSINLKPDK